jgi:dehydrogenase/reductase SDR family protein 7B
MKSLKDQVIWITGASSGIGEALAYEMSVQGAKLILSSRRIAELERVKNNCAHTDNVYILPFDLTDSANLEAKVPTAIALFGHIDIMVHNGGISQRALVSETEIAVHREVMELNYFSYIILTSAFTAFYRARFRLFCGNQQRNGQNRNANARGLRGRQTCIARLFRLSPRRDG